MISGQLSWKPFVFSKLRLVHWVRKLINVKYVTCNDDIQEARSSTLAFLSLLQVCWDVTFLFPLPRVTFPCREEQTANKPLTTSRRPDGCVATVAVEVKRGEERRRRGGVSRTWHHHWALGDRLCARELYGSKMRLPACPLRPTRVEQRCCGQFWFRHFHFYVKICDLRSNLLHVSASNTEWMKLSLLC